jgi:hypothetical protein
VLGELPHPLEGVLAIRWIHENSSFPCAGEAAAHVRLVMHLGSCLPWHRRRAAWIEVECAEGLNQAQRREPGVGGFLGTRSVEAFSDGRRPGLALFAAHMSLIWLLAPYDAGSAHWSAIARAIPGKNLERSRHLSGDGGIR